jgi:hypothetical protein
MSSFDKDPYFNSNVANFVHTQYGKFLTNTSIILTFHFTLKEATNIVTAVLVYRNHYPAYEHCVKNEQGTPEDGLISPKHVVMCYI